MQNSVSREQKVQSTRTHALVYGHHRLRWWCTKDRNIVRIGEQKCAGPFVSQAGRQFIGFPSVVEVILKKAVESAQEPVKMSRTICYEMPWVYSALRTLQQHRCPFPKVPQTIRCAQSTPGGLRSEGRVLVLVSAGDYAQINKSWLDPGSMFWIGQKFDCLVLCCRCSL